MPCNIKVQEATEARRLQDLDRKLRDKSVRLEKIAGVVHIKRWADRGGWCDECALRQLRVGGSFEVRRMIVETKATEGQIGHSH